MEKLIRIDKNGTKYYEDDVCPKCNGRGYIDAYYYNEHGVCFCCGGSGYHTTHWKVYTPEYLAKLEEKRLAKAKKEAPAKNAKFLKKEGFSEDGKTWIVLGNTYEIKDELKAAGCRWNNLLGWHFNHADNGFNCFEMDVSEVTILSNAGEYIWKDYCEILDYVDEQKVLHTPKTASEYVGHIGDKIELNVVFNRYSFFKTHYSYSGEVSYVYNFTDENGNTIVWVSSKGIEFEEGNSYTIKGTIKDHREYKNDKQTYLTRCKILAGLEGQGEKKGA